MSVVPILRKSIGSSQVPPAEKFARYDVFVAGAVAEWLGRGLQSLVHRFESGPRLDSYGCERGAPGEVPDALHSPFAVEPPEINLRRLGIYPSTTVPASILHS